MQVKTPALACADGGLRLQEMEHLQWKKRYGPSIQYNGELGQSFSMRGPMLWPYGDDPQDQKMIRRGFNYYKSSKNELEKPEED